MQRFARWILVATASSTLVSCGAAHSKENAPKSAVARRHHLVFVDLTTSGSIEDRRRWAVAASAALKTLVIGDRLGLYAIHDNTAASGALDDTELAPVRGHGFNRALAERNRLDHARRDFEAAMAAAAATRALAKSTDVLGAIEVARRQPRERRLEMWLLSDMIQANAILDLERHRLTESNIADILESVCTHYGWSQPFLAGARIHVVTASLGIGRRPTQEPRVLELFWTRLFDRLGADVVSYAPADERIARR